MTETAYHATRAWGARLPHHYGDTVHILADTWSLSLMERLSAPDVHPPQFHRLLEAAFRRLTEAFTEQLPVEQGLYDTRMSAMHPGTGYQGLRLDPNGPVVIVDVARGGMVPSYVAQQALHEILDHEAIRVDHVYMQRVTGPDGHVAGVETAGSKIGGEVAGTTVVFPDPMAATGSSMSEAIRLYKGLPGGPPAKIIACHLIVTPEYLRRMADDHPDVHIYALRLDRGLSSDEVLATPPGARWAEERGLDDDDYIVPGAGGLGELINNAFV